MDEAYLILILRSGLPFKVGIFPDDQTLTTFGQEYAWVLKTTTGPTFSSAVEKMFSDLSKPFGLWQFDYLGTAITDAIRRCLETGDIVEIDMAQFVSGLETPARKNLVLGVLETLTREEYLVLLDKAMSLGHLKLD